MSHSKTNTKFRNKGHLLTVPLFVERAIDFKKPLDKALFTLDGNYPNHPDTGEPLINAKETFIALEDVTGHKWAKQYLESYEHYTRFMGATWFREEVEKWVEEINIIQKARALKVVQELLFEEGVADGTRLSAAKYLAEQGWEKKAGKGRPSKSQIDGELKKEVRKRSEIDMDAERIGLKVVK